MSGPAPVRVLQVLTCDTLGGTENMLAALVEHADPSIVATTVVSLDAPGPIAARLAASGIRVRSLGGDGMARAFWRLGRVLRRERFDVVNAYGFKSTFVTRFLRRVARSPPRMVAGVRGLHVTETERITSPKARLTLRMDAWSSGLVDVYDANSVGAVDLLASAGVPRPKLAYIPNGIAVGAPMPRARTEPPMVLCVARFVARKRQEDLVRASQRLREAGVAHRLVLAGWGPDLERVRGLVEHAGMSGTIDVPGRVSTSEVRDLLSQATVFALVSTWEGMAGTVMEAMAAGLPVIGSNVNGVSDLVVDGHTGFLVEPEDPEGIAAAVARVLGDPARAAAMGEAGRVRVDEAFSLEAMVRAKESLYREVAAGRRPAEVPG